MGHMIIFLYDAVYLIGGQDRGVVDFMRLHHDDCRYRGILMSSACRSVLYEVEHTHRYGFWNKSTF